jgi:hypothetical protein
MQLLLRLFLFYNFYYNMAAERNLYLGFSAMGINNELFDLVNVKFYMEIDHNR